MSHAHTAGLRGFLYDLKSGVMNASFIRLSVRRHLEDTDRIINYTCFRLFPEPHTFFMTPPTFHIPVLISVLAYLIGR